MTTNEELSAHGLARTLSAAGIAARATGEGVHWKVEVVPHATRSLVVHCFWYERSMSGLLLGLNPANARTRLQRVRAPREGAEYFVIVHENGTRVADGRTVAASDVVLCARAWLGGAELEALSSTSPFMDQKRRAVRAIADRLDARLRWDIGGDPGYELWIYGNERSCRVTDCDGEVDCALFLGQAQIAYVPQTTDVPAVTSHWLLERPPVSRLPTSIPNVELERHAEVIEADPARWHWLHVRDRLEDPHDVLAPLRKLVAALAARPVPTRFFSFSSLNRFCFSASSHYPWVNQGLPVIAPERDGAYAVGDTRCDLADAINVIEATLTASPIPPFFGSAPHYELPLLSEALARQGSTLRPALQQQTAWYRLVVEKGPKQCEVHDRSVVFVDGTRRRWITYGSSDTAVQGVRDYLELDVSLDDLSG
jgi:hypothetical protein